MKATRTAGRLRQTVSFIMQIPYLRMQTNEGFAALKSAASVSQLIDLGVIQLARAAERQSQQRREVARQGPWREQAQ